MEDFKFVLFEELLSSADSRDFDEERSRRGLNAADLLGPQERLGHWRVVVHDKRSNRNCVMCKSEPRPTKYRCQCGAAICNPKDGRAYHMQHALLNIRPELW